MEEKNYKAYVYCHNCYTRIDISVPKGTRISEYEQTLGKCPHCDCFPARIEKDK